MSEAKVENLPYIKPQEEKVRQNAFCVISVDTYPVADTNFHCIETNNAWSTNPYPDTHAVVPDEMVQAIMETGGFCDIELNNEGTEVISFTAREVPIIPEVEPEPTAEEQLRADVDYLAIMTGVEL